ncbi:MAG: carbonic anhydrase, partial [Bdellovibrionota bacterium]
MLVFRSIRPLLLAALVLTAPASAPAKSTEISAKPTPQALLKELQAGNGRFASSHVATRKTLALGQSPGTIVLSCSDSRVPPELVFDQGLGRLFTVRVAGNVLTPETVASIEYAVSHLGSRLLVVLGHESCGAVDAALKTPAGGDAGSPDLNQLIREIQHNLSEKAQGDPIRR